jgi:hypothetical protein
MGRQSCIYSPPYNLRTTWWTVASLKRVTTNDVMSITITRKILVQIYKYMIPICYSRVSHELATRCALDPHTVLCDRSWGWSTHSPDYNRKGCSKVCGWAPSRQSGQGRRLCHDTPRACHDPRQYWPCHFKVCPRPFHAGWLLAEVLLLGSNLSVRHESRIRYSQYSLSTMTCKIGRQKIWQSMLR